MFLILFYKKAEVIAIEGHGKCPGKGVRGVLFYKTINKFLVIFIE